MLSEPPRGIDTRDVLFRDDRNASLMTTDDLLDRHAFAGTSAMANNTTKSNSVRAEHIAVDLFRLGIIVLYFVGSFWTATLFNDTGARIVCALVASRLERYGRLLPTFGKNG